MTDDAPAPTAAPIIVSATFAATDQQWLNGLRQAYFPPERNHLAAHLTLFHHLPPSLEPELRHRLATIARQSRPAARAGGIVSLGRGVAIAIDSPDLKAIRADLADPFGGVLTPQDAAGWRPHVTIQNKVSPHEARALQAMLTRDFRPRPVGIAGLAAWWYRGGSWELIAAYPFR
jgi:hypothetical protein